MVKAGIAERTLRAPVLAFRPDAPTGAVFGFAMFDTSDTPSSGVCSPVHHGLASPPETPTACERDRRSLGGDNSFWKAEKSVIGSDS